MASWKHTPPKECDLHWMTPKVLPKFATKTPQTEYTKHNMTNTGYQLVDFGRGRKIETIAGVMLDRVSIPAWGSQPKLPKKFWETAHFRFGESGKDQAESESKSSEKANSKAKWQPDSDPEKGLGGAWIFRWQSIAMRLKLAPFGHIGLFPEQIENWEWLQSLSSKAEKSRPVDLPENPDVASSIRPKALNLFAHTGGATLAMAAAGFSVTHVDASKPSVQWARENAELSGLEKAPIRWIVDNVSDFVRREKKRGSKYDVIVLDPPAFGHGIAGKRWDIGKDLDPLFEDLVTILTERSRGILLTGHSPVGDPNLGPLQKETHRLIKSYVRHLTTSRSTILDEANRPLDCGYRFVWRGTAEG